MRVPLQIYLGGFVLFLVSGLLLTDDYNLDLRFNGENARAVEEVRSTLHKAIDANGAPTITTEFSVGAIDRIYVRPGVKLIHDTNLGRRVVLEGPQPMVETFVGQHRDYTMELDFDRPIRTNRYASVRMDLSAHGNRLQLYVQNLAEGRSTLPALLETPTAIEIEFLELTAANNASVIVVETDRLELRDSRQPDLVRGKTRLLRLTGEETDQRVTPIDLEFEIKVGNEDEH